MATLTAKRIIIVLAEAADYPAPEPRLLTHDIRVTELPRAESPAFAVHVTAGVQEREARLSDAESRHLATLLEQLPPQSMRAGLYSLDGVTYELVIVQADQSLSFGWHNEDWRYDPDSPKEAWEQVAAITNYVLQLAKREG
jgi:hypothetical protein